MVPIQKLLNRIRWDEDFAKGDFAVGYYDRNVDRIIIVPFHQLQFDRDDHFSFQLVGQRGKIISIPYHRVREVYKDGKLIWSR